MHFAFADKSIALELERNIGKTIIIQELSPNLLSDLALYLGEWQEGSNAPTMASTSKDDVQCR
ncbi:MAG: hypothetical protein V7K48_06435 [Nostoc sp.]|uniref:hypothetical protein n=1 Tax=Nostoc sp. TaxID=1180 RepID=UPI002FFCE4E8